MGIAIYETLAKHGQIVQDELAMVGSVVILNCDYNSTPKLWIDSTESIEN